MYGYYYLQTAIIRERANSKLKNQLQERESELGEIKKQLQVVSTSSFFLL